MNKNKGILSLVGFLLAGTGFIAIILSLIGAQLSFLTWIDELGRLTGFLIKIGLILLGIIIIYLTQNDFDGDEGIGEY
jgi:pheromone shutdown protein TraB